MILAWLSNLQCLQPPKAVQKRLDVDGSTVELACLFVQSKVVQVNIISGPVGTDTSVQDKETKFSMTT